MDANKFDFGKYPGEGSTSTVDIDGFTLTATIERDNYMGAPWDNDDGHGPVSGWTSRSKRAGEIVLNEDRGQHRFYDFQEAVKLAKKDGWGWLPGKLVYEKDATGEGGRATCGEFTAYDPENFNTAISEVYSLHRATMSTNKYAAKAALRDFKALKAWCDDEWYYVGVVISATYDGYEISDNAAALWGVECDYPDSDNSYLTEIANDLLEEALEEAKKERARLIAKLSS